MKRAHALNVLSSLPAESPGLPAVKLRGSIAVLGRLGAVPKEALLQDLNLIFVSIIEQRNCSLVHCALAVHWISAGSAPVVTLQVW
jgi:hypothetical protein